MDKILSLKKQAKILMKMTDWPNNSNFSIPYIEIFAQNIRKMKLNNSSQVNLNCEILTKHSKSMQWIVYSEVAWMIPPNWNLPLRIESCIKMAIA